LNYISAVHIENQQGNRLDENKNSGSVSNNINNITTDNKEQMKSSFSGKRSTMRRDDDGDVSSGAGITKESHRLQERTGEGGQQEEEKGGCKGRREQGV
jgi:hypothetical protein